MCSHTFIFLLLGTTISSKSKHGRFETAVRNEPQKFRSHLQVVLERLSNDKVLSDKKLTKIENDLTQWITQEQYRDTKDPTVDEVLKMADDCKKRKRG